MAITVFIIVLFVSLLVLNLLILRYLKGSTPQPSLSDAHLPKLVASFDRYTLKFLAFITLIIIIFMLVAITLQYSFTRSVIHPVPIILFIFIAGVGSLYFFKSEANLSQSDRKLSTENTSSKEQK
ncbi:MAG TPA: hypothetical protein P5268_04825 [Candidatus Marinimicrobia bacterium]|nr:hypothetical protein [Candidatus Neomarinimicrobiota bacterium]HRS51580.1 hypothetical protein [Candidatus Neomarinimicrobiota bacterium]HRU92342.1 hypothetical protein [Candidatus Neomarinimicrobiota bacterium]